MAGKLEVLLKENDVVTAYRVPVQKGTPPIIVRLNYWEKKDRLITSSKAKKLKNDCIGLDSKQSIYVSEHVTDLNRKLLRTAKTLKTEYSGSFVWCKNEKIFVHQREKAATIRIQDNEDIEAAREKFRKNQKGYTKETVAAAVHQTRSRQKQERITKYGDKSQNRNNDK